LAASPHHGFPVDYTFLEKNFMQNLVLAQSCILALILDLWSFWLEGNRYINGESTIVKIEIW
jgi:hypothetical protein